MVLLYVCKRESYCKAVLKMLVIEYGSACSWQEMNVPRVRKRFLSQPKMSTECMIFMCCHQSTLHHDRSTLGDLVAQRRRHVEVGRLAARLTPRPNEAPRNHA